MKKIFLITDRNLTLSDSISRYTIDLGEGLTKAGFDVTIFSTEEAKRKDYVLENGVKYISGLPRIGEGAIFHFQFTFSQRLHTEFLLDNLEKLKGKSVVTLHVTPEYAEIMDQKKEMETILKGLSYANIPVLTFSNYAKYDLKRFMIGNCRVIYPGLNLDRYKKFLRDSTKKEKQILIVSSNPESVFVQKVKGFNFLKIIKNKYKDFKIQEVVNLSFNDYLQQMAKSQFYVALSEIEHYGFAIIDAYNLFTIPIYLNEGGLTEAVYGNGVPISVNNDVVLPKTLSYNMQITRENYAFSVSEHSIEKHIKNMVSLYKTI